MSNTVTEPTLAEQLAAIDEEHKDDPLPGELGNVYETEPPVPPVGDELEEEEPEEDAPEDEQEEPEAPEAPVVDTTPPVVEQPKQEPAKPAGQGFDIDAHVRTTFADRIQEAEYEPDPVERMLKQRALARDIDQVYAEYEFVQTAEKSKPDNLQKLLSSVHDDPEVQKTVRAEIEHLPGANIAMMKDDPRQVQRLKWMAAGIALEKAPQIPEPKKTTTTAGGGGDPRTKPPGDTDKVNELTNDFRKMGFGLEQAKKKAQEAVARGEY